MSHALTLIIDIGKSNAKLLLINEEGDVQFQRVKINKSIQTPDYTALDTEGLQTWLLDTLPLVPGRKRIQHIGITTHGAAFCGLGPNGLAIPAIDYEWDGYGQWRQLYQNALDTFEETGSPDLPQGLNAGIQLFWLKHAKPELWEKADCWVPYPQYWAWWLTGLTCTEVSSLGCHTHLWNPRKNGFANWAQREGLTEKFAHIRPAWDTLGTLRPELIDQLGMSEDCVVHVGLHDSNACLARHMLARPDAAVVSTGTWTVIMTPGLSHEPPPLCPEQEQFFNISIENKPIPTARFMGGREFHHLCHGADPSLATESALMEMLQSGWQALPQLAPHPDQRYGRVTTLMREGHVLGDQPWLVPLHLRPALASMYCAFMTAMLMHNLYQRILPEASPAREYIIEGPLAENAVYLQVLGALLGEGSISRPLDEVEGTARGAWLTTCWRTETKDVSQYEQIPPPPSELISNVQQRYQEWLQLSSSAH